MRLRGLREYREHSSGMLQQLLINFLASNLTLKYNVQYRCEENFPNTVLEKVIMALL